MDAPIKKAQCGFSLVEALVSLVVISVGMIGIASMYGQGLGASRTALFRTQAVNLAADMADRIRANRLGDASYNTPAPAAGRGCDPGGGTDCTPAQMAEHDLWVWTAQVGQQLPNGAGTVQFAAGEPPTYTIRVSWQETGLGIVTYQLQTQVPNR